MNTDSTTTLIELIPLAFVWLGYFVIHSLLASIAVKRYVATHWPTAMPAHRLGYNLLATLLLLPPLWLILSWDGPWLWRWSGSLMWLAWLLTAAAIAAFLWSLRYYDGREFLGLRQLSNRVASVEDQEHLRLSPLHRWVRHPWYSIALLLIWTRDMHAAMLLSAISMSLYFVIGSRLEERKLIRYHGESYRRYRALVPGLLPLPWRHLSEQQALLLENDAMTGRR